MEMDQRIAIATDSSCDLSDEILSSMGSVSFRFGLCMRTESTGIG